MQYITREWLREEDMAQHQIDISLKPQLLCEMFAVM